MFTPEQLCSALEVEMEISWSGTPGAAKKVCVQRFSPKVLIYTQQEDIEVMDTEYQTPSCHLSFSDGFYRPVNQISGAHHKAEANPSSKTKKRRSSLRGMAPSVVSFFFF